MRIRKGDDVQVISGKFRGKTGKVLVLIPKKERAIVEGVNVVRKHQKAGSRRNPQGGIVEREAPVHLSNLMPVDPDTKKPTRVGHKFLESTDGKPRKIRIARRSGAELDR